jgi:hypothetical protein
MIFQGLPIRTRTALRWAKEVKRHGMQEFGCQELVAGCLVAETENCLSNGLGITQLLPENCSYLAKSKRPRR